MTSYVVITLLLIRAKEADSTDQWFTTGWSQYKSAQMGRYSNFKRETALHTIFWNVLLFLSKAFLIRRRRDFLSFSLIIADSQTLLFKSGLTCYFPTFLARNVCSLFIASLFGLGQSLSLSPSPLSLFFSKSFIRISDSQSQIVG